MAIVSIGPIRLDPSTKIALEGILEAGGTKFPVELVNVNNEQIDKCSVMLFNDKIQIINHHLQTPINFRYNINSPLIDAC